MAGGRKAQGEFQENSTILSIRLQAETRRLLEEACEKSGRPLGQEIQWRVRRTFAEDQSIVETFGSRREYRFFRIIADSIRMAVDQEDSPRGEADKRSWLDDPEKFHRAMHACTAVFRMLTPAALQMPKEEAEMRAFVASMHGQVEAFRYIRDIAKANPTIPARSSDQRELRAAIARADLGDLIKRVNTEGVTVFTSDGYSQQYRVTDGESDEGDYGNEDES